MHDPQDVAETGPLILFDGVCNLCNGTMRFVLPRDRTGRLHFAAMQSATGQAILRRHGLPLDDFDSFLFIEEGTLYAKSRAAFRVAGYLKMPWPWLRMFRVLPPGLADGLYDLVARNRYRLFGRRETCLVPEPGARQRFLP